MRDQRDAHFPKGAETVLKMFTDQEYFLKKYEMCGASDIQLQNVSHEGDQFSITVKRSMPADVPVPGFAKKFVKDTMTVVQTDSWDTSNRTGRLDIDIKGLPLELSCDMELVDNGDSSVLKLDFNAKANVPMFAKKVERLILDDILAKFEPDTAAGVELLANY